MTWPIITLFASNLGASTAEIGMLTATYAFFPLVLAIYIGKIADYVGDRLPVILGTLGMTGPLAVSSGLLPEATWRSIFPIRSCFQYRPREGEHRAQERLRLRLLKIPMLRKALASSALVLYCRDIFVITIQGLTMVSVRLFLAAAKFYSGY